MRCGAVWCRAVPCRSGTLRGHNSGDPGLHSPHSSWVRVLCVLRKPETNCHGHFRAANRSLITFSSLTHQLSLTHALTHLHTHTTAHLLAHPFSHSLHSQSLSQSLHIQSVTHPLTRATGTQQTYQSGYKLLHMTRFRLPDKWPLELHQLDSNQGRKTKGTCRLCCMGPCSLDPLCAQLEACAQYNWWPLRMPLHRRASEAVYTTLNGEGWYVH